MFGHVGVRLFFVLSGYLITLMLIENLDRRADGGGQPLWHFYVRRALRLWPAYMLILGLAALLDLQNIRDTFWWHFFYATNFLFAITNEWQPWTTAGWWSLSVEEQFYLVWPALLLVTPRRCREIMALTCCALGVAVRMSIAPDTVAFTTLPFNSLDALSGGALLAMVDHRGKLSRWFPLVTPIAAAAIILSWRFSGWFILHVDEMLFVILFMGIVAFARHGHGGPAQWILGNPVTRYIGRISYGMYLYHLFAMAILLKYGSPYFDMFQHRGWGLMLFGSILTILIATLSWYLVEAPMNRLKKRFPFP